jgi:hypothetical protein
MQQVLAQFRNGTVESLSFSNSPSSGWGALLGNLDLRCFWAAHHQMAVEGLTTPDSLPDARVSPGLDSAALPCPTYVCDESEVQQ